MESRRVMSWPRTASMPSQKTLTDLLPLSPAGPARPAIVDALCAQFAGSPVGSHSTYKLLRCLLNGAVLTRGAIKIINGLLAWDTSGSVTSLLRWCCIRANATANEHYRLEASAASMSGSPSCRSQSSSAGYVLGLRAMQARSSGAYCAICAMVIWSEVVSAC